MEISRDVEEQPTAPRNRNVEEQPTAPRNGNVDEQPMAPNKSSKDWPFSFFTFDDKRDSPGEVRGAILVIAALLASASFQAMMNPPGAILNKSDIVKLVFICSITLAWSSSMNIVIMLTASFPFQREILLSYFATMFAFGLTAGAVGNITRGVPYILFGVCIFFPWASRWIPVYIRMLKTRKSV